MSDDPASIEAWQQQMSDDIVARLRVCACVPHGELGREAADEIERLRKKLKECEDLLDEYQRVEADRTRWENINE